MGIVFGAGFTLQGTRDSEHLGLSVTESPEQTTPTQTSVTEFDLAYTYSVAETSVQNAYVYADNLHEGETLELVSSDESIVQVSGNKLVHVGNGSSEITAFASGRPAQKFKRSVNGTFSKKYIEESFVAGTFARHIYDGTMAVISGLTQSNSIQQRMASCNFDITNPSATLSSNLFTNGTLDFSGVSIFREGKTTSVFPVTMVTARHGLTAAHVSPYVGQRYCFLRTDGTTQVATVIAVQRPNPNYASRADGDCTVVCFDQDITGVQNYKVMPAGWVDSFAPTMDGSFVQQYNNMLRGGIPTFRVASHFPDESTTTFGAIEISASHTYKRSMYYTSYKTDAVDNNIVANYANWASPKAIGGDSGGPIFYLINNEPVLCAVASTQDYASVICDWISEINTIMNDQMGVAQGTYALNVIDLSTLGFTAFA